MDTLWLEVADESKTQSWSDSPWWRTPAAQIAAVKRNYERGAAAIAREKELRAKLLPPLGLSVMRDPQTDVLISVREWVGRGIQS